MRDHHVHLADFGMDSVSLAGALPHRLAAVRQAGFSRVMLRASDLVDHAGGFDDAVARVRASGLEVSGFQMLRDFEGLSGHLHQYKVDIAKSMLQMCHAVGARLLVVGASGAAPSSEDPGHIARDLRKLAMLAVPLGIRVGYQALSAGRCVRDFGTAWDMVCRAGAPNLGLVVNGFHALAARTPLEDLEMLDASKIFLVQLADSMDQDLAAGAPQHPQPRVFPGEGVHGPALAGLVRELDRLGYRGDYSFEVFNDDYRQMPPPAVAARARRAALWLGEDVLQRALPLPGRLRLQRTRGAAGR